MFYIQNTKYLDIQQALVGLPDIVPEPWHWMHMIQNSNIPICLILSRLFAVLTYVVQCIKPTS